MTPLDTAWDTTRSGNPQGFADWVRLVELPLRASLRRFARVADVECVVQETLLRMWMLAPTLALTGQDASLRYAYTIARNLAIEETRRAKRFEPLPDEGAPDVAVEPEPAADPRLRELIARCFAKLGGRPKHALLARLAVRGAVPDRDVAAGLEMTLNTFLQNVVRARRALAQCFAKHGVPLGGFVP